MTAAGADSHGRGVVVRCRTLVAQPQAHSAHMSAQGTRAHAEISMTLFGVLGAGLG